MWVGLQVDMIKLNDYNFTKRSEVGVVLYYSWPREKVIKCIINLILYLKATV